MDNGSEGIASCAGAAGSLELVPVVSVHTERNRRNALNSTGPRTVAGRARSSRNGTRHGILSSRTVIAEGPAREDVAEYRRLLERLRDDLAPEGALEELLLERVASCTWRLGRVLRVESAQIRAAIEEAPFQAEEQQREREVELQGAEPEERLRDLAGIDMVLAVMRETADLIRSRGTLGAEELGRFEEVVGYSLAGMGAGERRGVEGEHGKAEILAALGNLEAELEGLRSRAEERVTLQRKRVPALLAIPDEATAARLQRYETAIERQLYKALHELQQLQARRRGEAVVPRVQVDVEVGQ